MYEIMTNNNYLFVYGTLLDADNEFGIYLKNNCSFYAEGKFKGLLYDIGEYPGAILTDGCSYVFGRIFIMHNVKNVLKLLDDYEGFGPEREQPNLFVRQMIDIESNKGVISCWCYLYNLDVSGLRVIGSGDYLAYRKL
jgi:gamma-glutamylcyclotransferase (GGCT)/AIG2-like uncharacterized protein YtfP